MPIPVGRSRAGWLPLAIVWGSLVAVAQLEGQSTSPAPSYAQAQSVLTKYCAGCHQPGDANGGLQVDTLAGLMQGGDRGPAITPGSSASSRLVQLMLGQREPHMPPEGEPQPPADDIQLVADWIEAGAAGPGGQAAVMARLEVPSFPSQVKLLPVTALALSSDEQWLAVARSGTVEILDATSRQVVRRLQQLPGKVTSVAFVRDGQFLVAGTGIAGLYGEAILFDAATGDIVRRYRGHRDLVYSVAISRDQRLLATSGYDRISVLWDLDSDKPIRQLAGHNDAVLENVFDSSGERLITASADATIKVWRVADGLRLDTLSDPLKEQYTVEVSPDGNWILAGGEDNRIRKWSLVSNSPNQTNPLQISRFAHESAVQLLRFHPDGRRLVSASSRGVLKVWDVATLDQQFQFPDQPDTVQALAVGRKRIFIGRMNGTLDVLLWPDERSAESARSPDSLPPQGPATVAAEAVPNRIVESEPNDLVEQAVRVQAPFSAQGKIFAGDRVDTDLYRFAARQGEQWIIETRAAQGKSRVDTHLAVLDARGRPVPRVLLQAVRDSYFTFRGKNSQQFDDYRVHNWEEMRLNQLLYCNGEVVRLYHYPRGPDSGFNVYPNFGKRHAMFDTSPITHALGEPCYIVEPFPPGTELPAIGLPQFLLNYENDDDPQQELGSDSRLTFIAPEDGDYLVRVSDVRDRMGDDFEYSLTVRSPKPGFRLRKIAGANPTLIPGGYRKVELILDRDDGFSDPVQVQIENLPAGVTASGPVTFEKNGLRAYFTLYLQPAAPLPGAEVDTEEVRVTAMATKNGNVMRSAQSLGNIKVGTEAKLAVELLPDSAATVTRTPDGFPILEIQPGGSLQARVRVQRNGHGERVNFGKQDAAINLPFGVYVANTGLNGVLIPPGETERTFLLTAEDWVQPGERLIFLEAEEAGKPASNPALLRVLSDDQAAAPKSDVP